MSQDTSATGRHQDDSSWHFDNSAVIILQIIVALVIGSILLEVMRRTEEVSFFTVVMIFAPMMLGKLIKNYLFLGQEQNPGEK